MSGDGFSLTRFRAVLVKEFIQMLRDRLTFAMMVGLPIMQLLLFGYAINADPRALPTAVIVGDTGTFARSIVRALENTTYFRVVAWPDGPEDAERADRPRRRAVRGRHSDRFQPPAAARRAAGHPGGGRRHRPGGDRQCACRPGAAQPDGIDARPDRAAAFLATWGAAVRSANPSPLQPGGHHRIQHRPRAHGHHPHHDARDDDGRRGHPRVRARHDGEPARHTRPAARGHARQDHPLCGRRIRSDVASSSPPRPSCSRCR